MLVKSTKMTTILNAIHLDDMGHKDIVTACGYKTLEVGLRDGTLINWRGFKALPFDTSPA